MAAQKQNSEYNIASLPIKVDGQTYSLRFLVLRSAGDILGYYFILETEKQLKELDSLIVLKATQLITLELLKENAVHRQELSQRSDLLEELFSGAIHDEVKLVNAGRYLGVNLNSRLVVCRLGLRGEYNISADNFAKTMQLLGQMIHNAFCQYPYDVLLTERDERIDFLILLKNDFAERNLVAKLHSLANTCCKAINCQEENIIIAMGRVGKGIDNIAMSAAEAAFVLRMIGYFQLKKSVVCSADSSLYLMLNELSNSVALLNYYGRYLQPLIQADQKYDGQLLNTLHYYFLCHKNINLCAEKLFVHRNTVAYRLKKVSAICGIDFENYQESLMLELCIMLYYLSESKL